MAHAEASVDIPVDADVLWRRVGSFQSVEDWHPMLASVNGDGEHPGAVRESVTTQGQRQVDRLREVDPSARFYRYTVDSSSLPVRAYVAEFRVEAAGEGASRVCWVSEFDVMPEAVPGTVEDVQTFLTAGLDNLRQQYAGGDDTR
jgi:Polyketide cyclase / dehydrase and lipid transport